MQIVDSKQVIALSLIITTNRKPRTGSPATLLDQSTDLSGSSFLLLWRPRPPLIAFASAASSPEAPPGAVRGARGHWIPAKRKVMMQVSFGMNTCAGG